MMTNNLLCGKEAYFKRELQHKLYELYPFSSVNSLIMDDTQEVTLEMFYYWKGKRKGLRHNVSLDAIEYYDTDEIITWTVLEIQKEITEDILREDR